jgi:hypothetical protein
MARTTRWFRHGRRYLSLLLALSMVAANVPGGLTSARAEPTPAVQPADPTSADLQQLVAPIALYPDQLVAQVLAAATYPDQVVEADRWLQEQHGLQGEQLARQVDAQPWDPSVKALVQFPSVLANMDKNLSWTSALGDAYVNHQQDVMDAIQTMRRRAHDAGNLKTTSEQKVVEEGSEIAVEPANPQVVYVPQYDPWLVYGPPVVAVAGMVPVSGTLHRRARNPVRHRLRHRLLRRVRLGMGPLGMRLGAPHRRLQPQHFRLAQQDVRQPQTFAHERGDLGRGARGFGSFHGAGDGRAAGGVGRAGDGRAPGGFGRAGGDHTLGSYHGPGPPLARRPDSAAVSTASRRRAARPRATGARSADSITAARRGACPSAASRASAGPTAASEADSTAEGSVAATGAAAVAADERRTEPCR